jgi:putative photosynthetic complex assembly protein 2
VIRLILPALYAVFVWWFATGAILWLDGRPRATWRTSMTAATVAMAAAFVGLAATADDASVAGTYLAFSCAIVIWGWKELAFLTGFVTGSRRSACPEGARGWRRAGYALDAILHHEFAIVLLGSAVIAIAWGGANETGAWTFLVLWLMRISAKLNLFLGVRNRGEAFLPEHLHYLASYFGRRPINPLLPVVVLASGLAAAWLWSGALDPAASDAAVAGRALVATLLSLAIVEHLLMIVPLPSIALWRWAAGSRAP